MALQLQRLVRPNILGLKPYRSARDEYNKGILLDANECVYGSSIPIEGEHHRYPCPYNLELKQKIAEFRGVKRNQVFLGVGSDEAIDMIMRVFCAPAQDSILVTPPTYDMYEVSDMFSVKDSVPEKLYSRVAYKFSCMGYSAR